MTIDISSFFCSSFEIITSSRGFNSTSRAIARLLNMPVETYNQTLIEKVIRHNFYEIHSFDDITFDLRGIDKEVYLRRFKEAFAPQLTLVSFEGN